MADPRFFSVAGPFSLGHLTEVAGAEPLQNEFKEKIFYDVAPLSTAQAEHISFWDNKLYSDEFKNSQAGACIVRPDVVAPSDKMALLRMADPYAGYAKIAYAFYPTITPVGAVSDSASIDRTVKMGLACHVAAGVVIGANVIIGDRTKIGANSVVGDGVELGEDCLVGPNVTLQTCLIGSRTVIHAGVRIGEDGFGFSLGKNGHLKIPQLGRVIIEDDVEIGANTTIDRGAGPDTVIGSGTKIDNLVQIAHNVKIGRNCIIASQVGISGSTEIGDFVMFGGQAGLIGHLKIGDGAQIAAQSGVLRNIKSGEKVGGTPAVPMRHWLKGAVLMEKLIKKNNERS